MEKDVERSSVTPTLPKKKIEKEDVRAVKTPTLQRPKMGSIHLETIFEIAPSSNRRTPSELKPQLLQSTKDRLLNEVG